MGVLKWQLLYRHLRDMHKVSLTLEDSIRLVSLLVSELELEHTYMKIGKPVEDQADSLLNRNEESA